MGKVRAALYVRVSTDEQVEKNTIESQLDFGRRWAELHEIDLVAIYKDPGVSGAIPVAKRGDGARLLADAEAGAFEVVLVYRLDRFARSLLELLLGIRTLEGCGVSVRSMTEPYDTGTTMGKFMVGLLGLLAEWERDLIGERTMGGRNRAAREGRWTGGPTPYGYRKGDDGRLEIDEEEAAIVRRIFERSLEGVGMLQIIQELKAAGVPSPNTKRRPEAPPTEWSAAMVAKLLHNRVYIGESAWGKWKVEKKDGEKVGLSKRQKKELIFTEVPAIIDPETFAAVEAGLVERRYRNPGSKFNEYPLSGVLKCGVCLQEHGIERSFVGGGERSGKRRRYRCTSYQVPEHKCGVPLVTAHHVEEEILEYLRHAFHEPLVRVPLAEGIRSVTLREIAAQRPVAEERLHLESAMTEKTTERERVLRLYALNKITERRMEEWTAEIDEHERELTEALARLASREDQVRRLEVRLIELNRTLDELGARELTLADVKPALEALRMRVAVCLDKDAAPKRRWYLTFLLDIDTRGSLEELEAFRRLRRRRMEEAGLDPEGNGPVTLLSPVSAANDAETLLNPDTAVNDGLTLFNPVTIRLEEKDGLTAVTVTQGSDLMRRRKIPAEAEPEVDREEVIAEYFNPLIEQLPENERAGARAIAGEMRRTLLGHDETERTDE